MGYADASAFIDYAIGNSLRRDPKMTVPDARSIIVAGIYIGGITLPVWDDPWYGRTSRLYLSGFFLDVVKPMAPIARLLKEEGYRAVVCDSASEMTSVLPLKLAAVRAGLGWQGKHSLLISKTYGTFLALGGVITNADFEHNTRAEKDRCLKCDKCRDACPMGALETPYVLNRNRCLSYMLQSDELPENARATMENRVGDCEICQDVCPWNHKHLNRPLGTKRTLSFPIDIQDWTSFFHLSRLAELSQERYKERLGGLSTDIPYRFFQRNVRIAMKNARTAKS